MHALPGILSRCRPLWPTNPRHGCFTERYFVAQHATSISMPSSMCLPAASTFTACALPPLRLDPPKKRFIKYQFSVLHSTALYFCAECTVAVGVHAYKTSRSGKSLQRKAITIARGTVAQVRGSCCCELTRAGSKLAVISIKHTCEGVTSGCFVFDTATVAP